jgi:tyrosine-protein kinase Tec
LLIKDINNKIIFRLY